MIAWYVTAFYDVWGPVSTVTEQCADLYKNTYFTLHLNFNLMFTR